MPDGEGRQSAAEAAKQAYADRRRRDRLFPDGMFRDPAWDMLLDLFVAQSEDREVSVTSAWIGSLTPLTTGLRELGELERRGFVSRRRSQGDRRRSLVCLTDSAFALMRTYFEHEATGNRT